MRVTWLFAIAACGTDRAPVEPLPDVSPDAPILPDTPLPAGCNYLEQNDLLNDLSLGNGVAEDTALTLAGTLVVCGQINSGHLIGSTVDADAFRFTLGTRTDLRFDFAGAAGALESLEISVVDDVNTVIDRGRFLGTHAAFHTTLASGSYRLVVTATNATDITAFDYKLRAVANPAACARVTGTAAYAEATDGPQSTGNDMIEISAGTRTLTTPNSDAPEPTALTLSADTLISGVSAEVTGADDFLDRDTYLVETGAIDELALRVDWTGDADLDVYLFPENALAEIGRGTSVGKTAPERAVFPVLPNTRYWLWLGSYHTSTEQVSYDISLCPSTFAP